MYHTLLALIAPTFWQSDIRAGITQVNGWWASLLMFFWLSIICGYSSKQKFPWEMTLLDVCFWAGEDDWLFFFLCSYCCLSQILHSTNSTDIRNLYWKRKQKTFLAFPTSYLPCPDVAHVSYGSYVLHISTFIITALQQGHRHSAGFTVVCEALWITVFASHVSFKAVCIKLFLWIFRHKRKR